MTTRANTTNMQYKAELEAVLDKMTADGRLVRVAINEVEVWEKSVHEDETGYIPGVVYLCRKAIAK